MARSADDVYWVLIICYLMLEDKQLCLKSSARSRQFFVCYYSLSSDYINLPAALQIKQISVNINKLLMLEAEADELGARSAAECWCSGEELLTQDSIYLESLGT